MEAGNILQIHHQFLNLDYDNHYTVHTDQSDSYHIVHTEQLDIQLQPYQSDQDLHLLQQLQQFRHIHVQVSLGIL